MFQDAEIPDRESRAVTRSNRVRASWLATGRPVNTKRYVTQVPNDTSGRREDDGRLPLSIPLSRSTPFPADVLAKKLRETVVRESYFPRWSTSENFILLSTINLFVLQVTILATYFIIHIFLMQIQKKNHVRILRGITIKCRISFIKVSILLCQLHRSVFYCFQIVY